MLELKPPPPRTERPLLHGPRSAPRKQQRTMLVALALLLAALIFVLYRDRDFWFPDVQEAGDQLPQPTPAQPEKKPAPKVSAQPAKPRVHRSQAAKVLPEAVSATEPVSITNRTVLPPLEIEVVAGDNHRVVRPGNTEIRVQLQDGSQPAPTAADPVPDENNRTASDVTTNAAERVQVSADTADVVTHAVQPGYPMLARQMKVQGSVILQALIGRDGLIQDLRVLGGPPILASAAQEAVRQWHFKPHYADGEAVETQARITVNFMISTN